MTPFHVHWPVPLPYGQHYPSRSSTVSFPRWRIRTNDRETPGLHHPTVTSTRIRALLRLSWALATFATLSSMAYNLLSQQSSIMITCPRSSGRILISSVPNHRQNKPLEVCYYAYSTSSWMVTSSCPQLPQWVLASCQGFELSNCSRSRKGQPAVPIRHYNPAKRASSPF